MSKIRSLESIRGALALTVFLSHVLLAFIIPANGDVVTPAHHALTAISRLAVVCFFVLSGYVIAMSIDGNRRGGFSVLEYALSRAFRIAPPFLAVVAITWAMWVVLLATGWIFVGLESAERMVFFTDPLEQMQALVTLCATGQMHGEFNGPMWSLAAEVRLYVFAGLVATMLWGRWYAKAASAVALAAYVWANEIDADLGRQNAMFLCFGVGVLAYLAREARARVIVTVGAAALVAAAAAAAPLNPMALRWSIDGYGWLTVQLLLSVAFAGGLILVARAGRFQALAGLGAVSYTLYILHFPVLQFFYFIAFNADRRFVFPPWNGLFAAVAGVLTFGVCVLVGRLVERPGAQRRWVAERIGLAPRGATA